MAAPGAVSTEATTAAAVPSEGHAEAGAAAPAGPTTEASSGAMPPMESTHAVVGMAGPLVI